MRKKKGLVSLMLSLVLCMAMCMPVSASEGVDTLSPTPPAAASEVEPRGANPPSSSADTHDLSVSSYSYQVTDMGYQVFTSKWITGASSIKITVSDWELLKEYTGAKKNELTLKVYNSSKKLVTSETITISDQSGSATLSGLTSTSKYYVCFEVPTNGNRYSFNGTISKAK
ncbi:MAG: hypothetical protein J1F42_10125 [Lachnospiraceae bacterium]|nr:hypothetical protein [Lachnospiraceae bacterium]